MPIYKKYKKPPIPPKHLWLEVDFKKIKFNSKKDLEYIINVIIKYNPELYLPINSMYKVHQKNLKAYIGVIKKYDLESDPIIMRKNK
jgi:hypothetical protein